MADGTEKIEDGVRTEREEIFSKSVRAGKRTYFFDVKTTRRNDYYLTLTESKKRFNRDGRFYFEKHKIFLYKEDFDKFIDGLTETIEYIKINAPELLDPEDVMETQHAVKTESKIEKKVIEAEDEESPEAENVTPEEVTDAADTSDVDVKEEAEEPITESFSNVEFEDLEDTSKS
jgi:hypothetical protein